MNGRLLSAVCSTNGISPNRGLGSDRSFGSNAAARFTATGSHRFCTCFLVGQAQYSTKGTSLEVPFGSLFYFGQKGFIEGLCCFGSLQGNDQMCIVLMNIDEVAAQVDLSAYSDWTVAATLSADGNPIVLEGTTLNLPAFGTAVLVPAN